MTTTTRDTLLYAVGNAGEQETKQRKSPDRGGTWRPYTYLWGTRVGADPSVQWLARKGGANRSASKSLKAPKRSRGDFQESRSGEEADA